MVVKITGWNRKDPPTVHVVGKLYELMMGRALLTKYDDLGNSTITIYIGKTQIHYILVDLGASKNVMTIENVNKSGLTYLKPTPTILEMHDISTIKKEGIIDNPVVSVDSWVYSADFVVLQPKSQLVGHPLIFRRPWLDTMDAFISCGSGSISISNGVSIKKYDLISSSHTELRRRTSIMDGIGGGGGYSNFTNDWEGPDF